MLAIKPFRRLWGVTYLCSTADWLLLLALTSFATKLTDNYAAQNFAFSAVVLTQLLPGLLFAPLGGLLADRFDRRKVMVICDVLRCLLLISIAVVGTNWWLFIGNFLVGCCAMMWIPSKDAAVPNLLRRPDQVETAGQLGLVMTYGLAVFTGGGLFAILYGIETTFRLPPDIFGELGLAQIALFINALLYLASGLIVATRIPEISRREPRPDKPVGQPAGEAMGEPAGEIPPAPGKQSARSHESPSGLWSMVRDAGRFIRANKLIRGLLIGMMGAFAAGGAVIGTLKPYSSSLLGGDASFALLFVSAFLGAATGMAAAPKLARRLPHDRLFGISIVAAGLTLLIVALSPHLAVSLLAVAVVGACAGVAFLTGVTIIGTQVEDAVRGRINAIYQSLMKLILFGATSAVPGLVAITQPRTFDFLGNSITIDGTRPVLLGGGLLAALVGVFAYRQMDSRRSEPILADLRNVLRRRPRRANGLLIAVEGSTATDTAAHADRLADWLRTGTHPVVLAADPALDDARLASLMSGASLTGARARALAAAAVRADIVERDVQPALDAGAIVVMERFVDSPLAHLSAVAGLDSEELEGLADWATGRLRPDVTILLDTDPGALIEQSMPISGDQWQVQNLLAEMAAADPDRYVVVDAEGTADEVGERVRTAVRAVLVGRQPGLAPKEDA
ncbi:MFS transporter [Amycolatopsis antarctica]|uniref:Thymidylate kinase n=1 Tax=Amycolatopsis antarctica TaxID=1854586 RepID=A0A263D603_9PSEU|nr:MFS transporter [Amycolatopsis antarctica]